MSNHKFLIQFLLGIGLLANSLMVSPVYAAESGLPNYAEGVKEVEKQPYT